MVAKLWYLKKMDLFSRLSDEDVKALAKKTRMENVGKGEVVYFPGEASDTVYILKEGRVRISRESPAGKRLTLAMLEPGELFGELSLAGEETRDTLAQTVEDSLICSAPGDAFVDFARRHPELSFEITRLIGDRRRKIETKIENLLFRDAGGRLAHTLLELFQNHAEENQDSPPTIHFSHQEIADLTGLTRPTTTNLLNDFKNQGFIELGRRNIRLANRQGLEKKIRETA